MRALMAVLMVLLVVVAVVLPAVAEENPYLVSGVTINEANLKAATTTHVPTALAVGLPIFALCVGLAVFKKVFSRSGGSR